MTVCASLFFALNGDGGLTVVATGVSDDSGEEMGGMAVLGISAVLSKTLNA